LYLFYKNLDSKIESPQKKYESEINSIMIEFNKLAKNNIDLLEEKIEELTNILKIADEKIKELKKYSGHSSKKKESKNFKTDDIVSNDEFSEKASSKKVNKYKKIEELLSEGYSAEEISEELGISVSEVNLYIELLKSKMK
jgi:DNA-binding NarL/FixJ family response regulator